MTIRSRYIAAITDKPWWLAGGIAPGACVAAYQAKGASDYAGSKINLANPGTYDAVDGSTAPTWDVENGWKGDGTAAYLTTGITLSTSYSMVLRYSNNTAPAKYGTHLGISNKTQHKTFGFYNVNIYGITYYWGSSSAPGARYTLEYTPSYGVAAATGNGAYMNGNKVFTMYYVSVGDNPIPFLCGYNGSAFSGFCKYYIQAAAVYNTILTDSNIVALTDAMNAL